MTDEEFDALRRSVARTVSQSLPSSVGVWDIVPLNGMSGPTCVFVSADTWGRLPRLPILDIEAKPEAPDCTEEIVPVRAAHGAWLVAFAPRAVLWRAAAAWSPAARARAVTLSPSLAAEVAILSCGGDRREIGRMTRRVLNARHDRRSSDIADVVGEIYRMTADIDEAAR